MRIWSLHPSYLDQKGLVALWRETLLAKHILEGKTKGYKNHPQLERFKSVDYPLDAINQYLNIVYTEAISRQYNFDVNKFKRSKKKIIITVTEEQLAYEFIHLLSKLKKRDRERYNNIRKNTKVESHPIFKIIKGPIESWEIIK
jgi:IS30 family transposase